MRRSGPVPSSPSANDGSPIDDPFGAFEGASGSEPSSGEPSSGQPSRVASNGFFGQITAGASATASARSGFYAGLQRTSGAPSAAAADKLPALSASGDPNTDRLVVTQYLMSRPAIAKTNPELLERNFFARNSGSALITAAYTMYRQSAQPAANLPSSARQREMLNAICKNVPPGISLSVQGLNVPLTQGNLTEVLSDEAHAIEIQRTADKDRPEFSENQTARLSIKLNPDRYEAAMAVLGSVVAAHPNSISHAKLMNPLLLGRGPEDAVIYMDNDHAVTDIVNQLQAAGVCRTSPTGIPFMRTLATGVYETNLPEEAFFTMPKRETGIFAAFTANGSVGRYNAMACVAAAITATASNLTPQEALDKVMNPGPDAFET